MDDFVHTYVHGEEPAPSAWRHPEEVILDHFEEDWILDGYLDTYYLLKECVLDD